MSVGKIAGYNIAKTYISLYGIFFDTGCLKINNKTTRTSADITVRLCVIISCVKANPRPSHKKIFFLLQDKFTIAPATPKNERYAIQLGFQLPRKLKLAQRISITRDNPKVKYILIFVLLSVAGTKGSSANGSSNAKVAHSILDKLPPIKIVMERVGIISKYSHQE